MTRLALISAMVLPSFGLCQSIDEEALMRSVFAELNPMSFDENVEYPATRGDEGSCLSDEPENLELLVASYHTHGGYSPDYSSELPSGSDMEGDEDEGIDGWVATPGGRLWYIDTTDMVTFQICGIGCLPSDPAFIAGESGFIEQSYSYDDLVVKLEE